MSKEDQNVEQICIKLIKSNAASSDIPAPQGEIRPCPAWCWSSTWPWLKGNSKLAWIIDGGWMWKPWGRLDTCEHLDGKMKTQLNEVCNCPAQKYRPSTQMMFAVSEGRQIQPFLMHLLSNIQLIYPIMTWTATFIKWIQTILQIVLSPNLFWHASPLTW